MIAFDTNILLYAADRRDAQKQSISKSLISSCANVVMPWQVACEFIAASRKLSDHGFGADEAWHQLTLYLDVFPLVAPSVSVLSRGRRLHIEQRLSFWDAMLVAACQEAGVKKLYTEDTPG